MTQPETLLQRRIRKALASTFPGCVFYKMHGSEFMESGIPDLIGCVEGLFFAIEVKHPDTSHGVTAIQQAQLDRLHEAGAHVTVAESVEDAITFVTDALAHAHVVFE